MSVSFLCGHRLKNDGGNAIGASPYFHMGPVRASKVFGAKNKDNHFQTPRSRRLQGSMWTFCASGNGCVMTSSRTFPFNTEMLIPL